MFFDAALWCAIRDSRLSGAERYLWTLTVFGYHQVAAGRTAITRQTADRPPGTISTLPPLADSPKCYMTHRWTERDSNPQSPSTVSSVRQLLPVVSGASASPIPFAVLRCSGSTKVAEPGSVPDRSLARYGLAGVSGTTAGTPSGLMLKARKVNGSLPGLPHWWTRPKGS